MTFFNFMLYFKCNTKLNRKKVIVEEIINLLVNNGIGVVCVAYLIYFQSTTMKEMNKTLDNVNENLTRMNERLSSIENQVGKR